MTAQQGLSKCTWQSYSRNMLLPSRGNVIDNRAGAVRTGQRLRHKSKITKQSPNNRSIYKGANCIKTLCTELNLKTHAYVCKGEYQEHLNILAA